MGGMDTESSYPYKGFGNMLGRCHYEASSAAAKVTSYEYAVKGDESAMKSYVLSTGPLSICVAAGTWNS